jgi:hypothetical protein
VKFVIILNELNILPFPCPLLSSNISEFSEPINKFTP